MEYTSRGANLKSPSAIQQMISTQQIYEKSSQDMYIYMHMVAPSKKMEVRKIQSQSSHKLYIHTHFSECFCVRLHTWSLTMEQGHNHRLPIGALHNHSLTTQFKTSQLYIEYVPSSIWVIPSQYVQCTIQCICIYGVYIYVA